MHGVGLFFAAMAVVVVVLAGGWWLAKQKVQRERTRWKDLTLEQLGELSIANEEVERELAVLKAGPKPSVDFRWAHDQVLLMTNGEYVVYAFWHSPYQGFARDLFLGHGSDGRWLYSTYHFCNSMNAVRCDRAPASIAEFEQRYWVREFDGKSDECLRDTWSPEE